MESNEMPLYRRRQWKVTLTILVCLALVLIAVGVAFFFQKTDFRVRSRGSIILYTDRSFPSSYLTKYTLTSPVHTFSSSSTSSILSYFEGSIRSVAVQGNYINQDEFVQFSDNHLFKAARNICLATQDDCGNLNTSFYIRLLNQTKRLAQSFVLDMDKAESIPYIVESMSWTQTIDNIKHAIYVAEKPILLSTRSPMMKTKISCTDPRIKDEIECENQTEAYLTLPATLPGAQFSTPEEPWTLAAGEEHTFIITGWNDDHNVNYGVTNKSNTDGTGGFVVRFNKLGYPDTLFTHTLTTKAARLVCQDPSDVAFWNFTSNSCLNSSIEPEKCDGTMLKCTDSLLCDIHQWYKIISSSDDNRPSIERLSNGMDAVKMVKWNSSVPANVFTFDMLPFSHIWMAFTPVGSVLNITGSICGYWFMPYKIFEELSKITEIYATSISIKWPKSSLSKIRGTAAVKKTISRAQSSF